MGDRERLTSGGRRFRVGEQNDAAFALLDELREGRLGAVVRLDLAAEGREVDGVADLGRAGGRAIGGARHGLLDGLDGIDHGGLCLAHGRLLLGLLGLGRGLLFGRARWRWGRRLALAELDHGGLRAEYGLAKL